MNVDEQNFQNCTSTDRRGLVSVHDVNISSGALLDPVTREPDTVAPDAMPQNTQNLEIRCVEATIGSKIKLN